MRGGIVLVPPIGSENRAARRAMRELADALGLAGYVVLRFDYRGTGDSSGDFTESIPDPEWLDDINSAVSYLRMGKISSVSVVGMRIGATLAAAATQRHSLDLASLVLWDPCESGRSYLREQRALESLRRADFHDENDDSIETSEFLFTAAMVKSLKPVNLTKVGPAPFANRVLVIERDERPLTEGLRNRLKSETVDFTVTTEQHALIETFPFFAKMPTTTSAFIVDWFLSSLSSGDIETHFVPRGDTVVETDQSGREIIEQALRIGPRDLFGVMTSARDYADGPWIVMINGLHEDHTGPSRLWVELSRRWAREGMRCLRVDVSGLGESPRGPKDPPLEAYDPLWPAEVTSLGSVLDPDHPSRVVFVGTCSGAFLALEGALNLSSLGVCVINPPVGLDYIHTINRMQNSDSPLLQRLAAPMKQLTIRGHWVGAALWQLTRKVLPSRWDVDVMQRIVANGTDVYVLSSIEDLAPFQHIPGFRSIDGRRAGAAKGYPFKVVPELDHDMNAARGRERAASMMQEHVRETFTPPSQREHDVREQQ